MTKREARKIWQTAVERYLATAVLEGIGDEASVLTPREQRDVTLEFERWWNQNKRVTS